MKARQLLPLAALLLSPLVARAADSAQIIQDAIAAASSWNGYACKVRIQITGAGPAAESFGELSFLKPGFMRFKSSFKNPKGGSIQSVMVSDGKTAYTETSYGANQKPIVFKAPTSGPGGANANAPSEMLIQFTKLFDLKIDESAPEEKLGGQNLDILAGQYRKGSLAELLRAGDPGKDPEMLRREADLYERTMSSIRIAIGREDKFLHRIEFNPPPRTPPAAAAKPGEQPPSQTMTFYEVTFNPPLTPADFAYVPPAGVQVMDPATTRPGPATRPSLPKPAK